MSVGSDPCDVMPSRRAFVATIAALGATSAVAAKASVSTLSTHAYGRGEADALIKASNEASASNAATSLDTGITEVSLREAEKLAGITFTDTERAQMLRTISDQVATYAARAKFGAIPNTLAPAQVFRVLPRTGKPQPVPTDVEPIARVETTPTPEELDWASVAQLGQWMRAGRVTSRQLVERSLARLRAANAKLFCVITLLEESALREADARDAEAKEGKWRGALHGIPYGLKDLFDTAGVATTWGAEPWRDRVPKRDARIVVRLHNAGAICVAKTAVGALAYGDIWFGGTCKNPWNIEQGSSGSSAGSASAVAAGCVPFAIGTETLGSIVSPSVRCGTTGLRPTFGRVSREGCMALCWSWDKVGPITRTVEDTGLVLEAINGGGSRDVSNVASKFTAPRIASAHGVRIAHDPAWFTGPFASLAPTLDAARACGATVVERTFDMPCDPSVLVVSLMSEAAASFEELTRSGADDTLSWQADEAWPNSFRQTYFTPAIELVQVERIRRRFMEWMRTALKDVDAIMLPPFAGGFLVASNATGNPQLVLRAGFDNERTPRSISLIGHVFDEATLVRTGMAIEAKLGVAAKRPEMSWL